MSEDVKRVTKTDALLAHIEGMGLDKTTFLPRGIRTKELAEATGVPAASISVLLQKHVDSGRLQMCRVAIPGGPAQNEYRKGIGVATGFKPLNTKRTGIAHGATTKPLPVTTPAPSLSTPKPTVGNIRTPILFTKTQPEVVATTSAQTPAADVPPPIRTEPAVADKATPKPAAGAALKKEPATQKASAGDDLRVGINADGVMVIALDDESIELNIHQVLRLGDFLYATQGVWRP